MSRAKRETTLVQNMNFIFSLEYLSIWKTIIGLVTPSNKDLQRWFLMNYSQQETTIQMSKWIQSILCIYFYCVEKCIPFLSSVCFKENIEYILTYKIGFRYRMRVLWRKSFYNFRWIKRNRMNFRGFTTPILFRGALSWRRRRRID